MAVAIQPQRTPKSPAKRVRNSLHFEGVTSSIHKTSPFLFSLFFAHPSPTPYSLLPALLLLPEAVHEAAGEAAAGL